MVNFCCSGYPPSPMTWLSESWGRMGQAIDRTETESSAVLLCRAGHTVRQLNRCRAQGQPSLFAVSPHALATLLPFSPCTQRVSLYGRHLDSTITQPQEMVTKMSHMAFSHKCPTILVQFSCCFGKTVFTHEKKNHVIVFVCSQL